MSILAVDFGSVHTRAVLIDQVNGVFQLVGFARTRTTDGFPAQNVTVGMARALNLLSEATGRSFATPDGRVISPEQADRSGADTVVVTASGGRPLRAVVLGAMPDLSLAAALRALSNTYVELVQTVHLADGRTLEQRLNTIAHANPDIVFIVGGTDGGATRPLEGLIQAARLAVSLMDKRRRPLVIYAGNAALSQSVITQFEGVAEVLIAANIRPDLKREDIESARSMLAQAFNHYASQRAYGFSELATLSPSGVMPSARGYVTITQYLAQVTKRRVIALDVGSGAVTLASASPKHSQFAIRADLGLGHNAQSLLSAVGVDAVRGWLPFEATRSEIRNYAANKTLRPAHIPADLRELYIEHALLRSAANHMAREAGLGGAPEAETLILGGAAINDTGSAGYSALLGIDALGMAGVVRLLADPYGLTAALGAVAASRAEAVVQVLDEGGYGVLGTAVCVSGRVRPDKPALKVKLEQKGAPKREWVVNGGHITVVPLGIGEKAKLSIRVLGGGEVNGKRSLKVEVVGGTVGLILDARGRPLLAGLNTAQRAELLPRWVAEVTGDEKREIPAAWLTPLDEPVLMSEGTPRTGKAKRRAGKRGKPVAQAPVDVSLDDLRKG
ncbi:MAG: glutamate mutase L [Anaerolineae bacterium]|nr:glutamate mutase L [Anaerolineae bacterium]